MRNLILNVDHIPGQNNGFQFKFNSKAFTIFSLPEGQLCFWNFSFLTESGPYISAGLKKTPEETVYVQSDCSVNKLYVDIQPEKRKPTVFFF